MRKLVSIFVFSATLIVGVFSLPVKTPTIKVAEKTKIETNFNFDSVHIITLS